MECAGTSSLNFFHSCPSIQENRIHDVVGAYAAQKVVQSPDVVGIYSRIIRLVETKLDEAIEKK